MKAPCQNICHAEGPQWNDCVYWESVRQMMESMMETSQLQVKKGKKRRRGGERPLENGRGPLGCD